MAGRRVWMGAVGLGRIGVFHAANLDSRVPSVELARIVDVDPEAARRASAQIGGVDWSTDFSDLLEDDGIEAVVISTNTPSHVPMIEAAAAAGKHVWCEKPISHEIEGTRRAVEAARDAGIKLQIGFHRRYDADHRAARERIAAGELGEVYFLRLSSRDMSPPPFDYIKTSGGLFVDVSLHDLDVARWFAGEVEEVTVVGGAVTDPEFGRLGDVDHAVISLRFASGAIGVIDNSRAAGYGFECSAEVVGSEGALRIAGTRGEVELATLGRRTSSLAYPRDFMGRFANAYLAEMEGFARAVADDIHPEPDGDAAIAAFSLSLAAARSYREGRTVRLDEGPEATEVSSESGEAL